jgi:MoaA/NifB/PqqE/SkfB family radical SAM enzyme
LKKVVSLHFTNECNGNCPFCYREKGKETMDEELLLDLPRYLKDVTDQIALGGGEPTLHPDLVQRFAQECKDYDLICNVTTNGFLFKEWNDEKIGDFCENLTMASVSLDREKTWHWKNGDEYLQTCKKVKKHAQVGCNLLIDENVMESDNFIKITDILFDKGLDRIFALYPKNIRGPDILPKKHHYEYLTTKYEKFYVDDLTFKILDEGKYENWKKPCHYGKDIVSIDEKGRVSGCSFCNDYKLKLEKPSDVLKIPEIHFEDRFACPYLRG